MQNKTCSSCKVQKPISEFEASRWYKDGYRGQCRPCRNEKAREYLKAPKTNRRRGINFSQAAKLAGPMALRNYRRNLALKRRFGISIEQFNEMSAAQGDACALCSFPASKTAHGVLNVDHCHQTGKVRGLLCTHCNSAIGRFGDNVEGARRVLDYMTNGAPSLIVISPK